MALTLYRVLVKLPWTGHIRRSTRLGVGIHRLSIHSYLKNEGRQTSWCLLKLSGWKYLHWDVMARSKNNSNPIFHCWLSPSKANRWRLARRARTCAKESDMTSNSKRIGKESRAHEKGIKIDWKLEWKVCRFDILWRFEESTTSWEVSKGKDLPSLLLCFALPLIEASLPLRSSPSSLTLCPAWEVRELFPLRFIPRVFTL